MFSLKRIHFVGIGGAGMSAIAWVLLQKKIPVSGSDLHPNHRIARLEQNGATIFYEHSPLNLKDVGLVVTSSAISEDNPEIAYARMLKLPIWHRSTMLAEILDEGDAITVAGTHGKTTTTAMLSLVLEHAELDPTILIGAELPELGGNAKLGTGSYIVAEADESDGSLLSYYPKHSIITNVESDHLDFYKTPEAIPKLFRRFLTQIQKDGYLICCIDNPGVRSVLDSEFSCGLCSYSLISSASDFFAGDIKLFPLGSAFSVYFEGRQLGKVKLSVPGKHNISNAMAALSLGHILGIDFSLMKEAIEQFKGTSRRFQFKGEVENIMVYDDYAHHPTEVAATINGALPLVKRQGGRLITVFQPHRFTRTKALYSDFAKAFDNSDIVIITDVYGAGETPIQGVSGELISKPLMRRGHPEVYYLPEKQQICQRLLDIVSPGDVVITMGAGNIGELGDTFIHCLEHSEANKVSSKGVVRV